VLGDEAGVNVAELELWMTRKVFKELYIGVQTHDLSFRHRREAARSHLVYQRLSL